MAKMGAPVGQTKSASFSKKDLDYYTERRGSETPQLPPGLSSVLYEFIHIQNLSPIKLGLYLEEHSELLKEYEKVWRLLEHLSNKVMKYKERDEVMGIKFHYLATTVKSVGDAAKLEDAKKDKPVEKWMKDLLRERKSDRFFVIQEKFLRDMLKEFPFYDSKLIQKICRTVSPVKLGNEPTALNMVTSCLIGPRSSDDTEKQCITCTEPHATKKCAVCNMVNYCNRRCQVLHWSQHKVTCKAADK